jgi:hypothetical protein
MKVKLAYVAVPPLFLAVLSLVGYGFWYYSESWNDIGTVSWVHIEQKYFVDNSQPGVPLSYWYTPFSFAIISQHHGTLNFTDPRNQNPCGYCHFSGGVLNALKLNTTVAIVKWNNNNYDLYFDP